MRPVVTVGEMRAIDAEACSAGPAGVLVERAGAGVARAAVRMLGGTYGRRVVVVAGKGHNGDDGRVAAERLRRLGARVTVMPAAAGPAGPGAPAVLPQCDLVIDAAYGTGSRGDYRAPTAPAATPVLSVDIPSGVAGDSGQAGDGAVVADATVTFAALKPGLVLGDGRWHAGQVEVADIGLDVSRARIHVVDDADVALSLPRRRPEGHKWDTAVAVVSGSPGMLGSARLCSRAAMRAGAGMVRLGVPGAAPSDLPADEVVARTLPADGWEQDVLADVGRCKALVVGPGLGRSAAVTSAVRRLVAEAALAMVVDADGLNALGDAEAVAELAGRRSHPLVLTPHAGEFARLAGNPPGPDHIGAARQLARRCRAIVLLKGTTTVVADPEGEVLVCLAGSPRLATAGTGDVLSGVIGALLARGVQALAAAGLGAHVHGSVAGLGPAEGLVAGDLLDLLPVSLSRLATVAPGGGVGSGTGAGPAGRPGTEVGAGSGLGARPGAAEGPDSAGGLAARG